MAYAITIENIFTIKYCVLSSHSHIMIAELIITTCFVGGVGAIIFLLFFNKTKTTKQSPKRKNRKHPTPKKTKRDKKQQKPKQKSQSEIDVERAVAKIKKKMNPALLKPDINLSDSEHLVSVFRGHIGNITGVAWHQTGKYLFTASEDRWMYCWEDPTTPRILVEEHFGGIRSKDGGPFTALNTLVTAPEEKVVDPLYVDHAVVEEEKKKDEANPLWRYNVPKNSVYASTHGSFGLCACEFELGDEEIRTENGRKLKEFKYQKIMKMWFSRCEHVM